MEVSCLVVGQIGDLGVVTSVGDYFVAFSFIKTAIISPENEYLLELVRMEGIFLVALHPQIVVN